MSCGCNSNPCCCAPVPFCVPNSFGDSFPSLVGPMGPPGGPGTYVVNYDALRALNATTFTEGYIAYVAGYAAVNDGGGGLFEYIPSATDAENDGTILTPTNTIGRWFRIYTGPANLLWFGGVADGTTNNDTAFANLLSLDADIVTPPGEFATNDQITVDGITWFSEETHLIYTNVIANQSCVVMNSDSSLLGSISITMPDGALGEDVNHLRVGGGQLWADGATNVKVGRVTVYGGHATMAAVLVEGQSANVYFEEVRCPDNDKIGQVFGCHWGNFADHYLDGGSYVNVPGGLPTTHPKNVRLDRLIVGVLSNADGIDNCAAFISSSRNVSIGFLSVDEASYAATIYGGDLGFTQASAADQANAMYGIEIGTVTGKSRRGGLFITGASSFVPSSDAAIDFRTDFVLLQPANIVGNAYPGISTDKVSQIYVGDAKLKFYDKGIACGLLSRNVTLVTPRIENTNHQGIDIAGTLNNECTNITILAPYITGANVAGVADPVTGSGITLSRVIGVEIVGGIVGGTALDPQVAALSGTATAQKVMVQNVTTFGSDSGIAFVCDAAPTDQFSFINCSCASGMTLRSGGVAVFMMDQRKLVMGLEIPVAGTWQAGDIVFQRAPALSGLPFGWLCLASGTPGTWAVMGQAGPRNAIINTPEFVGQVAVVAGDAYMAIGTASSADWLQITN